MDATELQDVLTAVRSFVRETVVPLEDEIEETDAVPDIVRKTAAEMGLFGYALPEEYGGLGLTVTEQVQVVMELGWTTPALRSMVGTNNAIGGHVLLLGGTDEQKREWLPRMASGEVVGSFGLTEADAGSDPSTLRTKAVRDGGDWLVTGSKRYITNAPQADVIFTFARTLPDEPPSRGIANLIISTDSPGFTIGKRDHKMGQAGAWSSDVHFDDVRVPGDRLIGGEEGVGTGFATAMRCLAHGRLHIAALSVGMAQRAVAEMTRFAQEREQGGRPIASYQLVQGLVADSVTELMAARALVLESARAYDDGSDRKVAASAAKYFASEAVGRIADRAVQVFGGAGYVRGVPVERIYRDARLLRLYEGTSQIQQVIIAKATLGAAARG